jgi:hypothetical protein
MLASYADTIGRIAALYNIIFILAPFRTVLMEGTHGSSFGPHLAVLIDRREISVASSAYCGNARYYSQI